MHPLIKQGFLLIATVALLILIVQLPHTWAWARENEGVAAWVQAIGVFAAVWWTGSLGARSEERQAKARQKQLVTSVRAVVTKASGAAATATSGLAMEGNNLVERTPLPVLKAVAAALTPLRIHELPTFDMIAGAVDISSDIDDLLGDFGVKKVSLEMNQAALLPFPASISDKAARLQNSCAKFLRESETWLKSQ